MFYGDWYKPNGEPRRRNGDNTLKVLLDEVANAAGIDDKWLTCDCHFTTHQAATEYVVVELS